LSNLILTYFFFFIFFTSDCHETHTYFLTFWSTLVTWYFLQRQLFPLKGHLLWLNLSSNKSWCQVRICQKPLIKILKEWGLFNLIYILFLCLKRVKVILPSLNLEIYILSKFDYIWSKVVFSLNFAQLKNVIKEIKW